MKKLGQLQLNQKEDLTQHKIDDLEEDLLTILEAHIDEMETGEMFYHIFKYMTTALYAMAPDHKIAMKVLRTGIDEAIEAHVAKKKEK